MNLELTSANYLKTQAEDYANKKKNEIDELHLKIKEIVLEN